MMGISKNPDAMVDMIVDFTCPDCTKIRKLKIRKSGITEKRCRSCAAKKFHKDNPDINRRENHYKWKGGVLKNSKGYLLEYIPKDDFYYPMTTCGKRKPNQGGAYCLQHRLVMARHLKRCLSGTELVHHVNGNKADNKIENLRIVDRKDHGVNYQSGFTAGFAEAMKLHGKKWSGERWE